MSIEVRLAKKTITSGIRELDVSGNKIAAKKIIYLILSLYVNLNISALFHRYIRKKCDYVTYFCRAKL